MHNTSGELKSHYPGARLEFDLQLDNENGDDDEVAEWWWWLSPLLVCLRPNYWGLLQGWI